MNVIQILDYWYSALIDPEKLSQIIAVEDKNSCCCPDFDEICAVIFISKTPKNLNMLSLSSKTATRAFSKTGGISPNKDTRSSLFIRKTISQAPAALTVAGVTTQIVALNISLPANVYNGWDRYVVEQIKVIVYNKENVPFAIAYDNTGFAGPTTTTSLINYYNVALSTQHGIYTPLEYVIDKPCRALDNQLIRVPMETLAAWNAGEVMIGPIVPSGTLAANYVYVIEATVQLSAPHNE